MADNKPRTFEIIKAILPKGIVWWPRYNESLEKLYETIGEIFDEIIEDVSALANLRIPLKTKWLSDLEREYGVTPPVSSTEEERRKYLDALAYTIRGNAGKDYIQNRLVRAGFPVTVIANQNPVNNPADFILAGYKMTCIDQDMVDASAGISYCGNPEAVCGFSGGELFVDGVNDYNALLPEDPKRWNFVFFVGGMLTGGLLLHDWNMEMPHCDYWPGHDNTFRFKDTTTKNTGNQSLLVKDTWNREEQELYPERLDASLVAAFRMYDLQQDLGRNYTYDYSPILDDWNMDDAGVTYWPAIGGATRSKTASNPVGGYIHEQNLLVEPVEPLTSGVRRSELEIGVEYILKLWLRVKSDILPCIVNGDTVIYDSTGNGYGTETWINTKITFIAESENLDFVAASGHNFSSGFQIDEVLLHRKIPEEILLDADMEENGVDNWEAFGGAEVIKDDDDIYYGNQCLLVATSAFITSGAKQKCLEIGKQYYICVFMAGWAVEGIPSVGIRNGNTIVIEEPVSTEYIKAETVFIAEDDNIDIICTAGAYPGVLYIDNIILVEIKPHEVKNIAPKTLIKDGDMEKAGTTDWIDDNDATLSKISSDKYIGTQCLKVEYGSLPNPYTLQNFITEKGMNYIIVCASKGDGVCNRRIDVGSTVIKQWDNSATWDLYWTVYSETVGSKQIRFFCEASGAGQYTLFDNIKVIPLNSYPYIVPHYQSTFNLLTDGNCEDPGTLHWPAYHNATKSKDTTVKYSGNQSLKIAYNGVSPHGIIRSILVVGKTYYVFGKIKREDIVSGTRPQVYNDTTLLWDGSQDDDDWQNVEIVFTATHEDLIIQALGTTDSIFIDNFSCIEIDPINERALNDVTQSGRTLEFNGAEYVNCNVIGKDMIDNFTFVIVAKVNGTYGSFIARADVGGIGTQWDVGINSSGYLYIGNTSEYLFSSEVYYPDKKEKYYHIVFTNAAGGNTKIYIDGKLDNSVSAITFTQKTLDTIIGARNDGDSHFYNGDIAYMAMYNIEQDADWAMDEYEKWLDVLWSGSDNRNDKRGIQQIDNDIELNNKKIRAALWLEGIDANVSNWYSKGRDSQYLNIDGTGDSPLVNQLCEYPSDKSVVFQTAKYYKSSDNTFYDIATEDFVIHALVYTNTYGEIVRKQEPGNWGYIIEILSDYKLKVDFNSFYVVLKTSTSSLPTNTWCFITIAVSKSGGYIQMYCNGESILSSTSLPAYTSLSNSDYLKVGNNTGVTVGFVSIWIESSWFSSLLDASWFLNIYEYYITRYKPDYWSRDIWNEEKKVFPFGGPYVEQMVEESEIPKYTTLPGLKNIVDDDEITIDGITEKPCCCYRGVDADDGTSKWYPYKTDQTYELEETGSGDDIEYGAYTDLNNEDRAVSYKDGGIRHQGIHSSDCPWDLDLHDFAIELILKPGVITDIFCIKETAPVGYSIGYNTSLETLGITISDGVSLQSIVADYDASANEDIHVLIVVKMNKGNGTQTGIVYINGENENPPTTFSATIGSLSNTGNFIFKGTNSDNRIAFYRMWKRYDWLDTVSQPDLASKLYTNYSSGGLSFPSPIPITAHAWGDTIGTIPLIMVQDYVTKEWIKLWHGSTRATQQTMTDLIKHGMGGIRLYPKFEAFGSSNFDDIDVNDITIDYIDLPKEKRRLFYHLLAQSKPLNSWAALLINWV